MLALEHEMLRASKVQTHVQGKAMDPIDRSIRKLRAKRPAFSLVEAVFVTAIIGIISAIVLPRYAGFVAMQQTQAAARRVLSDLTYAQRQARLTSSPKTVVFTVGTGTYELAGMNSLDRDADAYIVDLSKDPYRAGIAVASFGGDSTVIFDGYGAPDTGGIVTISVGIYRQSISVDGGLNRPRIDSIVTIEAAE